MVYVFGNVLSACLQCNSNSNNNNMIISTRYHPSRLQGRSCKDELAILNLIFCLKLQQILQKTAEGHVCPRCIIHAYA